MLTIEQSSEIRNALTGVKGRAQLAQQRLSRTNEQSLITSLILLETDMLAIDEAVNRAMVVVRELEAEAGIGAAVHSEAR